MDQIKYYFNDITERDMDMLFLEEFAGSGEFLKIFTEKAGITGAVVKSLYSSKTDIQLGESDITVVLECGEKRTALLIEDKIDAIAMKNQADRYYQRGDKGISDGEYDQFYVFIVAPQKYLDLNSEAQKYQFQIPYERILDYFKRVDDPRAAFKIHQIIQAIEKQKHGYQVKKDNAVTEFWNRYDEYQKTNYPDLKPYYKKGDKGPNAAWPRFNTEFDGLFMYHKTNFGYVDLTFDRCAGKIVAISEIITGHLGNYHKEGYSLHKTGKSAALRLHVPVLDMQGSFEEQKESIDECFKAIQKMTDTASMLTLKEVMSLLKTD